MSLQPLGFQKARRLKTLLFVSVLCLLALVGCRESRDDAHADHIVKGEISVVDAYARAAIPGSNNSVLYMTVLNGLDDDVMLVEVQTDAAASANLHETVTDDGGVTRMIPFADGVEIAAGESLVFEPRGKHVMLVDLHADFASGSEIEITLRYDNAESQTVSVLVQDPVAMGALVDELNELNVSEIHGVDEALDDGNIEPEFVEQVQAFGASFDLIDWQAVSGADDVMAMVREIDQAWTQLLSALQAGDADAAKPHSQIVHDVAHDLVEKVTSMQKLEGESGHEH